MVIQCEDHDVPMQYHNEELLSTVYIDKAL